MKIYLKYGLYYALGSILWALISYVLGIERMENGNLITLISIVIPISCIYLGIKEKRDKENNGFITYSKAFNLGLSITAVAIVISTVFTYFHIKYINTGLIEFVKNKQYIKMQEQGMDELAIEQGLSFSEPFMTPIGFTLTSFVMSFLVGIIISLIVAAILKRPDPQEIS